MARGTSFVNIMTVDSINQVLDLICECGGGGGGFYKVGRWPSACSRDNLSWFQLLEQFGKGVILEWRQNNIRHFNSTNLRPLHELIDKLLCPVKMVVLLFCPDSPCMGSGHGSR